MLRRIGRSKTYTLGEALQPELLSRVAMDVNRPMMVDGGVDSARNADGPAPAPGDAELARRVAGGDHVAATALIERYHAQVRRFLTRLTRREDIADDLAQETFVRMLRHAGRYDPQYPMRTWLLTIARRLSINRGRSDGRAMGIDDWHWAPASGPGPDDLAEQADEREHLRRRLDAAITQLTEPQRHALLLFHQQELSVQQAAEVMNLPVGTVKSHLHRARAALRQILGDSQGHQP